MQKNESYLKIKTLASENVVSEIKSLLDWVKSRLEMAGERATEPAVRSIKSYPLWKTGKKKKKDWKKMNRASRDRGTI